MHGARIVLVLLLTGSALSAQAAGARTGWSFSGELGAGYDDNTNNAGEEKEAAAVVRGGVAALYTRRVGDFVAVQGRAGAAAEACDPSGLSWGGAEARVRLIAKPGQGFYVPVVAVWGATGVRDYGSAIRDGSDTRAGVYLIEPLTTALRARLEATVLQRDARGRAFDLDEETWAVSLDWAPASWGTVYGEYRRKRGDIVVSLEGGDVEPKSYHDALEDLAEAIEPDDAYGEEWNAFRLGGARTAVTTLGVNVPLSADLSVDAQVLSADSQVSGLGYERWIGGVSLLLRF